ncbi:MAG: response regulator [Planctomycetes bacterium]|nr:response regulator [Planctomycetota bacterium]
MPEAKEKQNTYRDIAHASAHHILVVDDDMCIRKGLKLRLEGAGYKVSTAGNGTEGIMIFDENGADLMILDVTMPDIDGFEVCKSVKQKEDIPVIFLTGSQNQMVRDFLPQMVDAVGGDYFMRKPFDARLLMKLIGGILNGQPDDDTPPD